MRSDQITHQNRILGRVEESDGFLGNNRIELDHFIDQVFENLHAGQKLRRFTEASVCYDDHIAGITVLFLGDSTHNESPDAL